MQELSAGMEMLMFDLEVDVKHQRGALLLSFPEQQPGLVVSCRWLQVIEAIPHPWACPCVSSSCEGVCEGGEKTVVCKHWLWRLCKRGDQCKFLHEYDMTQMPERYFYSKFGECSNKECPFLHTDPASRTKDCPWYDTGFGRQSENLAFGDSVNGSTT